MWVFWLLVALAFAGSVFLTVERRAAVIVNEWEHALLYVDGRFKGVLAPGRHHIWNAPSRRAIHRLSSRDQLQTFTSADVLTADRFAARLGATVLYRITDPRNAFENAFSARLHAAAYAALTEVAAARSLETLLAERGTLGEALTALIGPKVPECELVAAISAVTLPPEVRRMLTDVDRAKVEGQAALERARSEHAALRSLANAARLLKNNPELATLRTLQALSPTGKGATLVLGQGGLILPVETKG